jgi:hypothetical protein
MVILSKYEMTSPGIIRITSSFYDSVSSASGMVSVEVSGDSHTNTSLRQEACDSVNRRLAEVGLPESATIENVIV